jgi:hypothetical protein
MICTFRDSLSLYRHIAAVFTAPSSLPSGSPSEPSPPHSAKAHGNEQRPDRRAPIGPEKANDQTGMFVFKKQV